MASKAVLLRIHRHRTSQVFLKSTSILTLSHRFSASSSSNNNNNDDGNSSKYSNFSYFKSKLRDQLQQQKQHPKTQMPSNAFDAAHETLRRFSERRSGKESFNLSPPMAENVAKKKNQEEEKKPASAGSAVAKTEFVKLYDDDVVDEVWKRPTLPKPIELKTTTGKSFKELAEEETLASIEESEFPLDVVTGSESEEESESECDKNEYWKKLDSPKPETTKMTVEMLIKALKEKAAPEESESVSESESGWEWESNKNDEKANETSSKEQKLQGHKRTFRRWTKEESDALVDVVKDLTGNGSFKVTDFYDPSVLNSIEEKLKVKLPESGLKVHPHIMSRLRYLQNVLGFKIRRYCTKEEVVNYIHPGQISPSAHGPPERIETSSGGASISKEEWARVGDDLVKGLSTMASILGKEIRSSGSEISCAMGYAVMLSKKRSGINEELRKLGLSKMDRHRATRKIASDPATIDIFYSIPKDERKEWVQAFLHGLI